MQALVVQNCATEDIGLYETCLREHGVNYHIHHAYVGKAFPSADQFDVFIVGGTPISVYDAHRHDFFRREMVYLREVVKNGNPYLGICGGAQLLAKLLGAEVRRNPVMEIGSYDVRLTAAGKKSAFFAGFPDMFSVFQWHGDTFDIPAEAKLLVRGPNCRNQAFSCRNSLGLQFHLEVAAKAAGRWADQYRDELKRFGKTKEQIVNECKVNEEQMRNLAGMLIKNFFSNADRIQTTLESSHLH
jgi:GMP synthase-like glutamine amidotransferase